MKTIRVMLLYCLGAILILAGCKQKTETLDLAVCGSYAVPGMFCTELKGGSFSCDVLEVDSYDRVMFSYTTQNIISKEKETAIVICQAVDAENVYFYEDECYLRGNWTEDDVQSLKETNDWNKELDLEKSAHRKNRVSFDLYIVPDNHLDSNRVVDSVCDYYAITQTQILEFVFMDGTDSSETYYLELEKDSVIEKYYIIVDQNYEVKGQPITDVDAFYAQIGEVK